MEVDEASANVFQLTQLKTMDYKSTYSIQLFSCVASGKKMSFLHADNLGSMSCMEKKTLWSKGF